MRYALFRPTPLEALRYSQVIMDRMGRSPEMSERVIELVLLKTKSGLSDDAFLATVAATTEFLKSCKGFICRRLAKGEEGQWLDYLEWTSMDDALAAAKAFNASPVTKAFNEAIDPASVIMRHLTVRAMID